MEFGKKGDARKAMFLHHRKGMSLKDAWKKVNKGKPKKEKKKKTDAKKAKRDARKAMILHHQKGMSLKKAWKEVRSKFGDTVCPEGFEPNTKWTGGKGQRQCIKKCDFYQMRDPISNRCKNMTILGGRTTGARITNDEYEMNPLTGRMRKKCKSGYTRSEITGKCRKDRVLQDGYEINPRTGRPRKICPPGWTRNESTGRCRLMRSDEFLVQPIIAQGIPVLSGKVPAVFPQDPFPNMRSQGGRQSVFGSFPVKRTRSLLFGKCSFGSCTACNAK